MNQKNTSQVTVILGDEFDDTLRTRLRMALQQLGAIPTGPAKRFIAGSQELETFQVTIDGRQLDIEAETYIGLSLSGPIDLVKQIQELLL